MRELPIKLGPLAVLLTVISICMTVLAILAFTTAGADMKLARTYADTVKTRYELEAKGQEFMGEVAEGTVAPDNAAVSENGVYTKTFELDGSYLRIGYTFDNGVYRIVEWRHGRQWEPDDSMGDLWDGN